MDIGKISRGPAKRVTRTHTYGLIGRVRVVRKHFADDRVYLRIFGPCTDHQSITLGRYKNRFLYIRVNHVYPLVRIIFGVAPININDVYAHFAACHNYLRVVVGSDL
ncbi:hypothetical protein ES703_109170 [subsurface metagenome]